MEFKETLLIHLGGLGDYCLSESTFHSVARHSPTPLVGLGTKRFLGLFEGTFTRIHGIESARWLYLFSSKPSDITWERIVFIGKDREGSLRERWQRFSREPMVFIDMYPEGAFPAPPGTGAGNLETGPTSPIHIEDYQLGQLSRYAITPLRIEPELKPGRRVILYPEKGVRKDKWDSRNFIDLRESLRSRGIETCLVESPDSPLNVPDTVRIGELSDVREFFRRGGIFVSNDSGMAHFAGMCGLATITIFMDFDPLIWHPRGAWHALTRGKDPLDVPSVMDAILARLEPFPP